MFYKLQKTVVWRHGVVSTVKPAAGTSSSRSAGRRQWRRCRSWEAACSSRCTAFSSMPGEVGRGDSSSRELGEGRADPGPFSVSFLPCHLWSYWMGPSEFWNLSSALLILTVAAIFFFFTVLIAFLCHCHLPESKWIFQVTHATSSLKHSLIFTHLS